jgi:hypothetical protein
MYQFLAGINILATLKKFETALLELKIAVRA